MPTEPMSPNEEELWDRVCSLQQRVGELEAAVRKLMEAAGLLK